VSDPAERLTFTAGLQKTWHNGAPDRDLLVGRLRYLPGGGWDARANVWIDFYTGGDQAKGSSIEVTEALLTLGRWSSNGNGFDLSLRHSVFPDIRRNEFPPLSAAELAGDRYDRVAFDGWRWIDEKLRLHGHASAYDDEAGTGGAGEIGVEVRGLLGGQSRIDLTAFGAIATFEDLLGGRLSFGRSWGSGARWDLLYEFSSHKLRDVPTDRDDLLQHRVRASGGIRFEPGWDLSLYGEGVLWDEDFSWNVGFTLQKRF